MTRPEDLRNGIAALADGEKESARRLRANLAVFARRADDPEVTDLVNEVLGGRRNVRDVVSSPQFARELSAKLDNLETGLRRLPPLERERLLDRARHDTEPSTDDERLDELRDTGLSSSPLDGDGEVESV